MDISQWRWTGVAAAAGCLMLAIGCVLAATAVGSRPVVAQSQPLETATQVEPIACASELYAFMKVAEAARDLGPDRHILSFALDDLQANLVDCLKHDDDQSLRDAVGGAHMWRTPPLPDMSPRFWRRA